MGVIQCCQFSPVCNYCCSNSSCPVERGGWCRRHRCPHLFWMCHLFWWSVFKAAFEFVSTNMWNDFNKLVYWWISTFQINVIFLWIHSVLMLHSYIISTSPYGCKQGLLHHWPYACDCLILISVLSSITPTNVMSSFSPYFSLLFGCFQNQTFCLVSTFTIFTFAFLENTWVTIGLTVGRAVSPGKRFYIIYS